MNTDINQIAKQTRESRDRMNALDNLRNKTFHPETMTALDWFIWNNRNLRGEQAYAELAALRAELERYETARQEDAKRLEQVTRERDAMWALLTETKQALDEWIDYAEIMPREKDIEIARRIAALGKDGGA